VINPKLRFPSVFTIDVVVTIALLGKML